MIELGWISAWTGAAEMLFQKCYAMLLNLLEQFPYMFADVFNCDNSIEIHLNREKWVKFDSSFYKYFEE